MAAILSRTGTTVWCQSGDVPIVAGVYELDDGTIVEVRQHRNGHFAAHDGTGYKPGLIWRLSAELDDTAARCAA